MQQNISGQITSRRVYQRTVPLLIASIAIIILVFNAYTGSKIEAFRIGALKLNQMNTIIAIFAGLFGTTTLLVMRARTLVSKKTLKDKMSSIAFYVTFIICAIVFFVWVGMFGYNSPKAVAYYTLTVGVAANSITAMRYSGHVFGAYKMTSRIRTIESAALLVSFVISLLGQSTFAIYLFSPIVAMRDWILTYPNVAGTRACTIGTAIGSLMMAARTLVLKETAILESEVA